MRITRGTTTTTITTHPTPLTYPRTLSPTGLLHFPSSHPPVDSHCCTISAVIGCMGSLLCKRSGGGADKQQQLRYGDEVQRMSHEQSSSCDIPHTASQQSLSFISIHETKKHARKILIRWQSLRSLFAHKFTEEQPHAHAHTHLTHMTCEDLHLSVDLGALIQAQPIQSTLCKKLPQYF